MTLALGCGAVYLLFASGLRFQFKQTDFAHHVLMADALLHGQLAIRPEALSEMRQRVAQRLSDEIDRRSESLRVSLDPDRKQQFISSTTADLFRHDWAVVGGRVYGYWGVVTPIVLTPFVAVFGAGVSDRLLNAVLGALNVGLFYWLMRRVDRSGLLALTEACCVVLTVLFGLGTVHFYLACAGRVWFAVQIVALAALLAALIAACAPRNRRCDDLWAGTFFGVAILARTIVLLVAPFFLVLIWRRRSANAARPVRAREFTLRALMFCGMVLLSLLAQAAYNYGRFGSLFDDGFAATIRSGAGPELQEDYRLYGSFHPHYLPRNIEHYFFAYRLPRAPDGRLWFDGDGNSMFLVTPPLLYAFLAWRRRPRGDTSGLENGARARASGKTGEPSSPALRRAFVIALLAGTLPLLAALMLFFATGYYQFGNRYLLDIMPLLLLLVASGMDGGVTRTASVLVALAIVANLFGTYRFCVG